MEVYKIETREIIRRFLADRLSFADCVATLDAALADLIPRLHKEDLAELRTVMLFNNATVMEEMERRGPVPDSPKKDKMRRQ